MQREDFHSPTWKRLSKFVSDRVDDLRKQNDQNHSIEKTAQIRGGISELKKILDLAEQASSGQAVNPDEFGVDHVLSGQKWPTETPPP